MCKFCNFTKSAWGLAREMKATIYKPLFGHVMFEVTLNKTFWLYDFDTRKRYKLNNCPDCGAVLQDLVKEKEDGSELLRRQKEKEHSSTRNPSGEK